MRITERFAVVIDCNQYRVVTFIIWCYLISYILLDFNQLECWYKYNSFSGSAAQVSHLAHRPVTSCLQIHVVATLQLGLWKVRIDDIKSKTMAKRCIAISTSLQNSQKSLILFLLKKQQKKIITDEDGIRTHAGRPQWISSPSP